MPSLMSKPKAPPIKPPAPMPDVKGEEARAAKKRAAAAQIMRGGRDSTVLTNQSGGSSQRMGG